MAGPVLGIDLGTTNSVVAVHDGKAPSVLPDEDGLLLIPSVVSFHPSGEVLVGRKARQRRLIDAESTVYSVKRLIGRPFRSEEVRRARDRFPFEIAEAPTGGVVVRVRGESHTLAEISAYVLREVRRVAERSHQMECNQAVVTVPANFNELQRNATRAAGRIAGLDVLRILNEPTAAALAYGYGRGSRERIAVFDLGGGTFDLTILELSGEVFEVLATAGDTYLGGDDIDELLADQMAKAFLKHHRYDAKANRQAYERLRVAAEETKCRLTEEEETKLRVEELAFGEGGVSLDLAFGLKRRNLETMAQPLIARCFDVCEEAMRVAGIRPTQLDNIVLVGGATRMPLVKRMVEEYFGRRPLDTIDPDLVVAKGAAIQGHALSGVRQPRPVGRVQLKRVTETELARAKAAEEEATTLARRKSAADLAPPTAAKTQREMVAPPPLPGSPLPDELEDEATQVQDRDADSEEDGPTKQVAGPVLPTVGRGTIRQGGAGSPPGLPPVPPAAPPSGTLPPPARPEPPPAVVQTAPLVAVAGSPAEPSPSAIPTADSKDPANMAEFDLPSLPPPSFAPPPGQAEPGFSAPPGWDSPAVPTAAAGPGPGPGMPLLLDVTPLTLGVETVSGFCEPVIPRNAAIPAEQTRIFTTAQDNQEAVHVRICQGESRRLGDNQGLGEVQLMGLRPGPRGQVQIGVSFSLSADGTLSVRATDLATGQAQSTQVELVGALSEQEIAAMHARQNAQFPPS